MKNQSARNSVFLSFAVILLTMSIVGSDRTVRAQDEDVKKNGETRQKYKALHSLLKARCFECHSEKEKEETGVVLTRFSSLEKALREPEVFAKMLSRVKTGEMPPETPLSKKERGQMVAELQRIVTLGRNRLAGDPGRVTLRRLNKAEYNYTVQDLFGIALSPADEFPDDDVGYGFDTVGDVLSIPPLLLERYLDAAERIAKTAVREFQPVSRRWKAPNITREGRGGNWGGFAVLSTNGSFSTTVKVRWAGEYVFLARVFGQQAGPEDVRMAMKVDGINIDTFSVPNERKNPGVFKVKVKLKPGTHTLSIAFLNDYWNPGAKDKNNRDRNMAADWLELKGPLTPPTKTPFEDYLSSFGPVPKARTQWPVLAQKILTALSRRAFRRPATKSEVKRILGFFESTISEGESFHEGLRSALSYLLVSPHFIYRVEIDADPDNVKAVHHLSDHELATRLSYFLWSSLPDNELDQLADSGQLRPQLGKQARRMLDDPRSSRFVEQFAGQWLQLRRLTTSAPDPDAFPDFSAKLAEDMRIETEMFFEAILRENRSILDFLDANFTFVNGRLAKHYGLNTVKGPRWRRVRVAKGRGGLLGHASILTISSNPTRSSPVKRGKWILEALLDDPPPPPAPGTDSLAPIAKSAKKIMSMRERFELHRSKKECAVCHDRLDPLGFALENFDGIGAFRERMNGKLIDVSAQLPGGKKFQGLTGLRNNLRAKKLRIVRGLARNLMVFALGRGNIPSDAAVLDSIVQRIAPRYQLSELIVQIVKTDAFQKRRGESRGKRDKNGEKK